MRIESLRQKRKNSSLYVVTIDGTEYELAEDAVVAYRLKKNGELDEPTLALLLSDNEKYLCADALVRSLTLKTEREFRDKLFQKGFSRAAVDYAIEYGKKHGLVDDARYAQNHYEKYAAKKGVALIRYELKQKGVPSSCLSFLQDEDDDAEVVRVLARKFMKNKENTPENKVKLMRHLASKGFSYSVVKRVSGELLGEDD